MKIIDRVTIIIFSLSLFLVSILVPAFIFAKSPTFYQKQFAKNEIYATINEEGTEIRTPFYYLNGETNKKTYFTDEQLDIMINHIVDYLFTDLDSFELVLDGVIVNGKVCDNVSIFGEKAVVHMKDVKVLFQLFYCILISLIVLMIILIVYFVYRFKYIKKLFFKYALIVYGCIIFLGVMFCFWCYCDLLKTGFEINLNNYCYILWQNCHYLFFPFQPDKIAGSSFNDILTEILTLDLFMDAVVTCIISLVSSIIIWLSFGIIIKLLTNKKIKNKEN